MVCPHGIDGNAVVHDDDIDRFPWCDDLITYCMNTSSDQWRHDNRAKDRKMDCSELPQCGIIIATEFL